MKRVVLACFCEDPNLGDPIIFYSFAYLLRSFSPDVEIIPLDLWGRKPGSIALEDRKQALEGRKGTGFFARLPLSLIRKLPSGGLRTHLEWKVNPDHERRFRRYCERRLEGADLVVFPGGGIFECTSQHQYCLMIDMVSKLCEKQDIPVFFNAAGLVVDERHMYGWGKLRRALGRRSVKAVTCRDGVEWVNSHLLPPGKSARLVPCSALYASEAFGVTWEPEKNAAGIGVIRGNVLSSYGKSFSEEDLLSMYKEIIQELSGMGFRCYIFTDGFIGDYKFACSLSEKAPEAVLLPRPVEASVLVRQISRFSAIVTARLHSCITAYSLGVPMVGLVWNKKVSDFFSLIGKPHAAIEPERFSPEEVIRTLQGELESPYDKETRERLRAAVREGVREIAEASL